MPRGVYDRSQASRPNRREEILNAATAIYAHYGFEGATLERMAAAAGVSKSLIMDHFGSKKGLVTAIATEAVKNALARLEQIDQTPGLTLRAREELIHQMTATGREEWCLILGTMLVPSFQFPLRGEIAGYQNATFELVLHGHLRELREPTRETAYAYAYSSTCMHVGYILSSREDAFHQALERHLNLYLRPEAEILAEIT